MDDPIKPAEHISHDLTRSTISAISRSFLPRSRFCGPFGASGAIEKRKGKGEEEGGEGGEEKEDGRRGGRKEGGKGRQGER